MFTQKFNVFSTLHTQFYCDIYASWKKSPSFVSILCLLSKSSLWSPQSDNVHTKVQWNWLLHLYDAATCLLRQLPNCVSTLYHHISNFKDTHWIKSLHHLHIVFLNFRQPRVQLRNGNRDGPLIGFLFPSQSQVVPDVFPVLIQVIPFTDGWNILD